MADKPTLATAYVGLIPTLDGSQKQIEKELGDVDVDGAGKKAGGRFGKILGGAAIAGIGAVIAGAGAVLKTGFQEAMDASAGNAQLAAGIKSTGNAANVTLKGLNDYASSLQKMSGQTDDSITAAQKLLLTFTNIKNEGPDKIFDQATLAATDMAAKMGGDAASNAVLLGKALNDPVKGVAALTRVGVAFTKEQKAMIKAQVEGGDANAAVALGLISDTKNYSELLKQQKGNSQAVYEMLTKNLTPAQKKQFDTLSAGNDTIGAQKTILAELNKEFGGAAEAAGKSLPGQLEIMKRGFEDVSQSIVEKLIPVVLPVLTKIAGVITDKVLPAVDRFIQGFKDGTGAGGKAREIFEKIRDVLAQVGQFIAVNVVPRVKEFGQTLAREVVPKVQALAQWITGTLVPGLITAGQWIIRNRDWLSALAVAIGSALLIWKAYTTALAIWKAAQMAAIAVQAAWNVVMAANPIGIIVIALAALVAGLVFFFTKTELGKKIWQGLTDFLVKAWEWIKAAAKSVWDFLIKVWSWSPLGFIITNWGKITAYFGVVKDKVVGFFQGVWDFIKKAWSYTPLGLITTNWDKIMTFFKGIPQKLKDGFSKVTEFITAPFKAAFNAIAGFWNKTVGKLSFKAPSWVPGLGGKGWDVPDIPMLAKGGTFTRSGVSLVGENGPELLYGNRGASVVPLDHPAAAEATSGRSSVSAADVEAIAGRAAGEAMAGALAEVRRLAETLARMNVQPGF